ncbi:MAG: putative addiction module component (TIGR02574 family) [Lysobacterales bacterium]|jgi:putative addiction module component (TIGR02574 family)
MKVSAAETLDLPISERIQLVTEIWDSIAEFPEKIDLTPATRKLLAKRLASFRSNPGGGSPWQEVKNRITSR